MVPPANTAVIRLFAAALALLLPAATTAPEALEFLGSAGFDKGETMPTQRGGPSATLGGFSGLAYEATSDEWWMISDRGGMLWKIGLDLGPSGRLEGRDSVRWLSAVQLRSDAPRDAASCPSGQCSQLDAEGVAVGCSDDETLVLVSTEGPAAVLGVDASTGEVRPRATRGVSLLGGERVWAPCLGAGCPPILRPNKMLESLTCSAGDDAHPHIALVGLEDPMLADGPLPTPTATGSSRIFAIDTRNGDLLYTARYEIGVRRFADSDETGLVDLEVLRRPDTDVDTDAAAAVDTLRLLSMERSYSGTGGWAIQLFLTAPVSSATDVSSCTAGFSDVAACPEGQGPPLEKTLLLDMLEAGPALGFETDNYEALAIGPRLADGRYLLLLVNDDNCASVDPSTCWGGNRIGTTFLAFAFDPVAAQQQPPQGVPAGAGKADEGEDGLDFVFVELIFLAVVAIVTLGLIILCLRKREKMPLSLATGGGEGPKDLLYTPPTTESQSGANSAAGAAVAPGDQGGEKGPGGP